MLNLRSSLRVEEGNNMPFCPNCGSPIAGNFCERCGWNAAQMAQQQYPPQYQQPIQQQYTPPQGRSDLPLIVGAIVIAIVVILAGVLFVVLTSKDDGKTGSDGNGGTVTTVPTGAFDFTETSNGNYTGGIVSLSGEVRLSDCSITIIDTSTGASASQGPPIRSGYPVQAGSGLKLTFTDTNSNKKVDAGDVWTLTNAQKNDQIKLIHDTGKAIAAYTIP